jgi:VWFA-related protein
MVDAVVRDKSGKPVTDLKAADFELYEDDVRQEIGDVTLMAPPASKGAPGSVAPAGAPAVASGTVSPPTVVALVFDKLSSEARALAHKGAMAYLETSQEYLDTSQENDFAGVFLVDMSLQMLQTYTTDRAKLRIAINEAALRAGTSFTRSSDKILSGRYGDRSGYPSPTASAEERGPQTGSTPSNPGGTGAPVPAPGPGNTDGAAGLAEVAMRQTVDRMERSYEAMMRDDQGFASTNALLALIDSMSLLPGRKTVVYFAEGLAIPTNVQARFDSVVATANRANVSVYTVDAAGLRVHSSQAEAARNVNLLGNNALERDADALGSRPLTEALEQNEDILRQDPAASLGLLADRTGGFLINNTNALERGFRTIDNDRRFHYLLTYNPKNADFKGEWRRLTVKVPSRSVVVRSRAGYLAVRAPGALPLLSYEGPALAALERTPLPKDMPARGGVFNFPDASHPGRLALLVATDASAIQVDTTPSAYKTDFTILARIRNAQGEVVRKASQPYRLTGPAAQVQAVKQGDVLFFRQPDLPPGQYTVEYAVADALSKRVGAGSVPLLVPDVKAGQLAVSSLVLVRRTEKVPANQRNGDNPLYLGDLLLYPNLGEPVKKGTDKTVSFFLRVMPAGSGSPISAVLELTQGTQAVGQVPMELAKPNAAGVIEQSSQLPLANFPPGSYGLRIAISQGAEKAVREATFTVVD